MRPTPHLHKSEQNEEQRNVGCEEHVRDPKQIPQFQVERHLHENGAEEKHKGHGKAPANCHSKVLTDIHTQLIVAWLLHKGFFGGSACVALVIDAAVKESHVGVATKHSQLSNQNDQVNEGRHDSGYLPLLLLVAPLFLQILVRVYFVAILVYVRKLNHCGVVLFPRHDRRVFRGK